MGRRLSPSEIEAALAAETPEAIVERLSVYITDARRERIEDVLAGRLGSLSVALENPWDPHNAAAVVRSAEAFGASEVHVIQASTRILRARKTTAGTHRWVGLEMHGDLDRFFDRMRNRGIRVAGACVDEACALEELPMDGPICLLLGNEHEGLSAAAKSRCDHRYKIPMQGFAESLNLSVSAAISLYVSSRRRREVIGARGDLDAREIARLRARWYLNSVDARTIRGLAQRTEALEG